MSSVHAPAMSGTPKRGWFDLNDSVYPGSEGATTVNASAGSPPNFAGSVSIEMILWNSHTEPGQPCDSNSGIGCGPLPGTWMKCTSMPPAGAVNCGKAFRFASWARQSKPSFQY